MGFPFPTRVGFFFLLSFIVFSGQSAFAQNLGFRCTNSTTTACTSVIDYKLPNTTTLSSIRNLFQIKNLRTLLAANNLPITTLQNHSIPASQILKIPFPCSCSNGTGVSDRRPVYTVVPDDILYHIAAEVFSGLVTFQQIQTANNIVDADKILVGQRLWIPLPCSCDSVDGETVVHYGFSVAADSSVGGIAQRFNTTESTLLNLNGMNSSADLKADSIIDVPLKVCTTSVKNDSMDYPLLVPNGTYTFTANNCVRCQCNAANSWTLECEPSGIVPKGGGQICPSMQCPGTSFDIGNTSSVSDCRQSRCTYGGYRNGTILTEVIQESTCPGGSGNVNNPSLGNGLRPSFVLGASLIALVYLAKW